MTLSAFYFASGRGERMRPLTDDVPKPLLPVKDEMSLLELNLLSLKKSGVKDVFISYSYRKDLYVNLANKYKGAFRITLVDDKQVLGHGGVLLNNRDLFRSDFLIGFNADTFVDMDIDESLGSLEKNIGFAVLHSSTVGELPKTLICDQSDHIVGIKGPTREYFYCGMNPPSVRKQINNLGVYLISVAGLSDVEYAGGFMGLLVERDLVEMFLMSGYDVISVECPLIRGFYSMNTIEEYEKIKFKLKEYRV